MSILDNLGEKLKARIGTFEKVQELADLERKEIGADLRRIWEAFEAKEVVNGCKNKKDWFQFTDRENVLSILSEGLKPRGDRPANYHGDGLDSNPAYVYLTERMTRPWHGMDYRRMTVLAIDDNWLDESLEREDEDKEKFGTVGTIAYDGVIHSDAIEDIWFYEPRVDDRGVLSYVMVRQDFRGWDGIWD